MSDWKKINSMSDEELERNALDDPDNPPTDAAFWADVDMQEPETRKVPIHIRVAPDVLEFFKKDGPGYQSRINRVLEQFVNWHQPKKSRDEHRA
jgi:uncharacterized protein (DUF4415 family)